MLCGFRKEVARIPISGMKMEAAKMLAEVAIKAAGSHAAIRVHKDNLVVFQPVSIRFDKMAHLTFCDLNERVNDFVLVNMGVTADRLLEQTEKAA
jgi:hypothetical protein